MIHLASRRAVFPAWGLAALCTAAVLCGTPARAFELEPGVNTASVIEYPTALDQTLQHTVSGTIEVFDLGKPDLALENIRYGAQFGAFQALADVYFLTDPDREFDHGVLRAKLRILHFEPERTSIAVGGLWRITDNSKEADERIDNRPLSLMGIVTTELFPFQEWGGFLINGYLDNRVANLGVKVQIYRFIKAVGELDYYHSSPDIDDKEQTKGGIEIEGETNFYVQAFYAERLDHLLFTVGVGF